MLKSDPFDCSTGFNEGIGFGVAFKQGCG